MDTATDGVSVLRGARCLLEREESWVRGSMAMNALHGLVAYWDREAVCFCVSGAIRRASYDLNLSYADPGRREALGSVCESIYRRGVIRRPPRSVPDSVSEGTVMLWNDSSTVDHAEVLAVLDEAIERLEGTARGTARGTVEGSACPV